MIACHKSAITAFLMFHLDIPNTKTPNLKRNGNPFTGYQGFTGDTGYCGNEKKRGDS
jgi:hypothetical protein